MSGEYELGGLNGESTENFDLSQVFNTQQTPELNQPQTYSWNDFFTPQNQDQINDRWIPDNSFLNPTRDNIKPSDFTFNDYTFTSLPYKQNDWFLADVTAPDSYEGLSQATGYGFRGNDPRYFKDASGRLLYTQQYKDAKAGNFDNVKWSIPVGSKKPGTLESIANIALPMLVGGMLTGGVGGTAGLGGTLGSAFGGGVTGNALGYGLASGGISSLQGGDFGKGFLGGAVSGGIQGLGASGSSPASMAGINSPTLAGMFNRGTGSALGALASGNSGSDALKSGLTGAALSGINSVGKSVMNPYIESFKSWLGTDTSGGDAEFDALQGSGGDMSMQTDVSPNRYDEFLMSPDGMETYNPDYRFGGDQMMDSFSSPDQSVQSSTGQPNFSLQSVLGDVGSRVGNYALNNVGDLASMLYGFYNNRRQQRQLQQPMNNMSNQVNQATTQLQNMFTQNSPYAQQLRAKLNAQAAASGRRSNTAGRETQFQAMLAEKAASTLPQIANMQNSLMQNQFKMQQQHGKLRNTNMDIALMGLKNTGLLGEITGGLRSLFGPSTTTIPYNNGNVSGSDMFGWKGSGGM